jgi:hypothetical protein
MREEAYGYTEPSTGPIPQPFQGEPPAETGQADGRPERVNTDPGPVHAGHAGANGENTARTAEIPATTATPSTADTGDAGAVLFGGADAARFREQWRELQAEFVDDPTKAVQGADRLVDDVLRVLAETFAAHKHELEGQWQGGGTGETEELRVAMRRYRSFLDQLLNA